MATNQHKVTGLLGNLNILFETVDYTAKGNESDRKIFQKQSKKRPGQMTALAPQIFNGDVYCGDYADFELANKNGSLQEFLKLTQTDFLSTQGDDESPPVRVEPLMVSADNE